MQPAVLIRLRPIGPWRYGPGDGGHDRVDTQYRSDRLYSAVTLAMKQLGWMEEWLDATARSSTPPVAFTSLFPFQGGTLFVTPPATLWPPPASQVATPSPVFLSKIRWTVATFVPASLVETILLGENVLADQWLPDPESACLLRRDRLNTTPFHTVLRSGSAVDRVSAGVVSVHSSACVEFEPGAGLWTIARYRDEAARSDWGQRIAAAFRLLADGGFGGKRSSGWGQTEAPEFEEGTWPGLLLPKLARALARNSQVQTNSAEPPLYWLLSLFAPGQTDQIDWSGGDYRAVVRGGYVEGAPNGNGSKKRVRMIAEGSVLAAPEEIVGAAVDVSPEGHAHPVYRSGIAVSLRLPAFAVSTAPDTVEAPGEEAPAETEPAPEPSAPTEPLPEEPAVSESPAVSEESPVNEEPAVSEESSVEAVEEPAESLPGSPELLPEMESHGHTSSEVEPQSGSGALGSIEDPDAAGEGPDHGI
jgi:CRISPR type III-A-associated RAMP protein Csm4